MNKLFITILPILLTLIVSGQSVFAYQEKPFWTRGYFFDANNSYIEVVSAEGWEVNNARNKAYKELLRRRGIATGTDARVSIKSGNLSVESNKDLIVKARVISEYVEQLGPGEYKVYLLVQTAKNPTFDYEQVRISTKYPFSARCFVPGMAQIYKGSKGKGAFFISAELLGVGGIVLSSAMKSSDERLMREDPKHRAEYSDRADMWQNVGYGCIAFTATMYLINVIDGIAAHGKPRIFINRNLAVTPTISFDGSMGLAMRYKF